VALVLLALVAAALVVGCSIDTPAAPLQSQSEAGAQAEDATTTQSRAGCSHLYDCAAGELCVASGRGIATCRPATEVSGERVPVGPNGQLPPPVGMLEGRGRLEMQRPAR
jgi:hypothetical protein